MCFLNRKERVAPRLFRFTTLTLFPFNAAHRRLTCFTFAPLNASASRQLVIWVGGIAPRKHKPRKTVDNPSTRRAAKRGGRRPRPAFSSSRIRSNENVTRYTPTRRVKNWKESGSWKWNEKRPRISGEKIL